MPPEHISSIIVFALLTLQKFVRILYELSAYLKLAIDGLEYQLVPYLTPNIWTVSGFADRLCEYFQKDLCPKGLLENVSSIHWGI